MKTVDMRDATIILQRSQVAAAKGEALVNAQAEKSS